MVMAPAPATWWSWCPAAAAGAGAAAGAVAGVAAGASAVAVGAGAGAGAAVGRGAVAQAPSRARQHAAARPMRGGAAFTSARVGGRWSGKGLEDYAGRAASAGPGRMLRMLLDLNVERRRPQP